MGQLQQKLQLARSVSPHKRRLATGNRLSRPANAIVLQQEAAAAPETGGFSGDKRDRTADLLNAIQALTQYKRAANHLRGVRRVFAHTGNTDLTNGNLWYNLDIP